jgi:hypothetical protein
MAYSFKYVLKGPSCVHYNTVFPAFKFGAGMNNIALIAGATGWGAATIGIASFIYFRMNVNAKPEAQIFCGHGDRQVTVVIQSPPIVAAE